MHPVEEGQKAYQAWYEAHGFKIGICYAEMIRQLSKEPLADISPPKGFEIRPLNLASEGDLFQCYYDAFSAGDAQFFFDQGEQERREYYNTLGYKQAISEPASVILLKGQRLIGFSFVLPYGENNCHISCMCIDLEFRRMGLGEFMLHTIMDKASRGGYKTITLGTDTSMGAYKLYVKNGFEIVEGNVLWQWHV
jgi:ribosomal protein S18 acetylase RimI-like enzyme